MELSAIRNRLPSGARDFKSPFRSEFIDPCVARFSKIFAKTVQNTKNRSIRIVFQYKFTIKPAIFLAVEFPEVLENFAEIPWPE